MPDLTTDRPLPATGPGSTYLWPIHCCTLAMAIDIATDHGGPVMVQVFTSRGISQVGRMYPSGRFEVSP